MVRTMPKKTATIDKKQATKKARTPLKTENGGFAVIATGGKQYKVSIGDSVKIEKMIGDFKEGQRIVFDKVLLTDDGKGAIVLGTPNISGSKVTSTLIKIGRAQKVIVLKYKQKSRYYKKNGHRQPFFEVKIDSIS